MERQPRSFSLTDCISAYYAELLDGMPSDHVPTAAELNMVVHQAALYHTDDDSPENLGKHDQEITYALFKLCRLSGIVETSYAAWTYTKPYPATAAHAELLN